MTDKLTDELIRKLRQSVTQGYDLGLGTAATVLDELLRLRAWQMDVEEREAAVCPEDVKFDEYIRAAEKKVESQAAELERLREIADRHVAIGEARLNRP